MVNILLSGCCGRMGRVVRRAVDQRDDCRIVAGIDLVEGSAAGFPIYSDFSLVKEKVDVIVDFSHPSVLSSLLAYIAENQIPAVLATTGYSSEQIEQIKIAAVSAPLFFSFNMSLGINLLVELAKKATCILGDSFDIEIVEAHHNQKIDAPSGTALMLANGIQDALNEDYDLVYERHSRRQKREKKEIGIHSIRGGTIVGEHSVIFAGHDEVVTLSHSAASKEVFATGAVRAAMYMVGRPAGLYSMSDLIK